MRGAIAIVTLLCGAAATLAQSPAEVSRSMRNSSDKTLINGQKLIVVITPDWNSVQGALARYQRQNSTWQQIGDAFPVVVGHNGLAWDPLIARGYSGVYPGPIKHEGDGRSPAGLFQVKQTFGFDPALPGALSYLPLTENTECVDDAASRHYGQIVDRQELNRVDWNSSEKMRSVPGYRWGAVVNYNMKNTIRGDGSCIFLHQWSGPREGTAGCTAMSPQDIELLVQWLKGEEHATLVQLPKSEYEKLYKAWRLPLTRTVD